MADLVDNSIEAGATRIDILIEFEGDNSFVRISDNGKGMTADELKEAMRYGSERAYNSDYRANSWWSWHNLNLKTSYKINEQQSLTAGIRSFGGLGGDRTHQRIIA